MKILFYSAKKYDVDSFTLANHNYTFNYQLNFINDSINIKNCSESKGYQAICVFVGDEINAEIIDVLSDNGISLILLRASGFDKIDIKYATNKGIKVATVPSYSPHAVAEYAVTLILSLMRHTAKADLRVKFNNFSIDGLVGSELHGKTVGIIGLGRIGKVFRDIMLGFGCKVLAFDPILKQEIISDNFSTVSLNTVIEQSDIISLHCPLNKYTHKLINSDSIAKMKSGVILINVSRGAIIDTEEVIQALRSEKIKAFGADVYEHEAPIFFTDHSSRILKDDTLSKLQCLPNVILTGHQGFLTKEALNDISYTTLQNIFTFFEAKEKCTNLVN